MPMMASTQKTGAERVKRDAAAEEFYRSGIKYIGPTAEGGAYEL